jgi:hypothetical protein
MSPLFLLWAIRGNSFVPDKYLLTACGIMLVLPNMVLGLRIRAAMGANDKREITVGVAEDHRDHLLVYLFSMLLPFYATELRNERDVAAVLVALAFIVFRLPVLASQSALHERAVRRNGLPRVQRFAARR